MMKNLLENDYVSHYGLTASVSINVASTSNMDFDLNDDVTMVCPSGTGVAKYHNPNVKKVNVINYELFFKSLPQNFQQHKKNCDLIVYTSNSQYFLLNELTKTGKNKSNKRTRAILQMRQTLQLLSDVPAIQVFINRHSVKQCCYFNKKAQRPSVNINATDSFFNRQNDFLSQRSSPMSDTDIENLGFELWEFSGAQTYLL